MNFKIFGKERAAEVLLIWLVLITNSYAAEIDAETGLIMAENFELVKTNCTICHSAKNITNQRGSRLTWLGLIRWMQDTQGLKNFNY